MLSGCKSCTAIAQFGRDKGAALAFALGFRRGKTPTKSRLSTLFRRLDVTAFEADHSFRYTYETLDYLVAAEPGVNFVWIMGADSLLSFDRWERWEEIAQTMPMAIYARPGATFRATRSRAAVALEDFRLPEDNAEALADAEPPAWVYLRGVMSAQSSTAIRKQRASSA